MRFVVVVVVVVAVVVVVVVVCVRVLFRLVLRYYSGCLSTILEPQSRFGDKPVKF